MANSNVEMNAATLSSSLEQFEEAEVMKCPIKTEIFGNWNLFWNFEKF